MLIILLLSAPFYRITCKNKKAKKYWCIFLFLLLFLVMAFRDISVGIDTRAYCGYFVRTGARKEIFNIVNAAPIYNIYSKLLYMLFPYENAIIIANALIVNTCICCFIYYSSLNAVHSVYIYVISYMYLESFNGTRQSMAIGFLLMAYCMREKKHIKRAIIFAILACGIHLTAIAFIPFLLIDKYKLNKNKTNLAVMIIVIGALITKYALWPVINFITRFLPQYAKYLKYNNFIDSGGRGNNIYVTIFYLVFLLAALFIINNPSYKNKNLGISISDNYSQYLGVIVIFSAVTIVFGLLFSRSLLMNRMRQYFSIYWIVLIPSIYEIIKNKVYSVILYICTYLILFIPFIIQLFSNQGGVVPYVLYTG